MSPYNSQSHHPIFQPIGVKKSETSVKPEFGISYLPTAGVATATCQCSQGITTKKHIKAMKILSIIFMLGVLIRETRHLMLYPALPILLATEEFILPEEPPSTETPPPLRFYDDEDAPGVAEHNTMNIPTEIPIEENPTGDEGKGGSHLPPVIIEEKAESEKLTGEIPVITKVKKGKQIVKESETVNSNLESEIKIETPPSSPEEASSNQEKNSVGNDELPSTPLTTLVPPSLEASEKNGSQSQQQTTTGSEGKEKDEEKQDNMGSYSEWLQKKKEKEQELNNKTVNNNNNNGYQNQASRNHQNGSQNTTSSSFGVAIDAKNFASPDCGAKIVQAHSKAQKASGVLSSSRDEYMLNTCEFPIWLVIELCEPAMIERVLVGNLELFSSTPKEIEVGISDRYPTRDWVKLGPFELPNSRIIHTVDLPSTNSTNFGKFVKISVLSHYGTEHYCPLSVVKINGKSEYEVLDKETTHEEDQNKEVNGLPYDEHVDAVQSQTEGENSGGGLKDTVFNILNKAIQIVKKTGTPTDTSEVEIMQYDFKSKCNHTVIQCVPPGEMQQQIYDLLSCNGSNLLPFLSSHSQWCGWDYCHSSFSRESIGLPWEREGFFASLFGGPAVLQALCHFKNPLIFKDGCGDGGIVHKFNASAASISNIQPEGTYTNESILADNDKGSINEKVSTKQDPSPQSVATTPEETPPSKTLANSNGNPPVEPPIEQQLENPSQPSLSLPPIISTPPVRQETQIPSPTPIVDDPSTQQQQQNQQGGVQMQNAVFLRISNRIKVLEQSHNLTTSYLEELSIRFKKQNEEQSLITQSNKKDLNETRIKLVYLDQFYRLKLHTLQKSMEEVREKLQIVQMQRSFLMLFSFFLFTLILIMYCWVRNVLDGIKSQVNSLQDVKLPAVVPESAKENSSIVVVPTAQSGTQILKQESKNSLVGNKNIEPMMRKRSNSDVTISSLQEKSRKAKRKKGKNIGDLKPPPVGIHPINPIKGLVTSQSTNAIGQPKMGASGFVSSSSPSPSRSVATNSPISKENADPHRPLLNNIRMGVSSSGMVTPPINIPFNGTGTGSAGSVNGQRPNALGLNTDSPFSYQSSLSSYTGVTTSGRFAILASPGPDSDSPLGSYQGSPPPPVGVLQLGSSTAAAVVVDGGKQRKESAGSTISTTSTSSTAPRPFDRKGTGTGTSGKNNVLSKYSKDDSTNGAATTNNGSKKGKKTGLNRLMPKLFDW